MTNRPFVIVVTLLVAFIAWGGWMLLRPPAPPPEEVVPPRWSPVEAAADELRRALPSWAEVLPETQLDPASELPTPVRDPRTGILYALVPAGETTIGDIANAGYVNELAPAGISNESRWRITRFEKPYYLGREEVSFAQWKRFLAAQEPPRGLDPAVEERLGALPDDRPMVLVSREEALQFARWAGGRLPTEAEWEYAAKGDAARLRFPWGASWDAGDARLAVDIESILGGDEAGFLARALAPCGASQQDRSWCGVRDLAGNAAEWVIVPWRAQVGRTTLEDAEREELFLRGAVVRGGSWASPVGAGRCTQRDRVRDGSRLDFVGFRVLRES